MVRIFPNDAFRTLWLQAFSDFIIQVDSGARTPKQAIARLEANLPGNLDKQTIAVIIAGYCSHIGSEMSDRLSDYIDRTET